MSWQGVGIVEPQEPVPVLGELLGDRLIQMFDEQRLEL